MSNLSEPGYFPDIAKRGHEAVVMCSDAAAGLRAFIAVHNTVLGPALGGCRMKFYASEEEALLDALRLSRAMTYKSSMAGLNLGGGKTVVMLDNPEQKTPELLQALAERINLLQGTYIGAGDVGSNTHDLKHMRRFSPWIVGLDKEDGGLGDSAILTSLGVYMGIKASVKEKLGRDDLDGIRVAVQGAGKVGSFLISRLLSSGCTVYVSDTYVDAVERVRAMHPEVLVAREPELYELDVDVFSPNAIGGLITESIAVRLKAPILAGGANNPLSGPDVARQLHDKGVLYAPDFLINAGGIIMVDCERRGMTFTEAESLVNGIYEKTLTVYEYAKQQNVPPWEAARMLAVKRIEETPRSQPVGDGQDQDTPAALC